MMTEYTIKLKDVTNEDGEENVAVSFSSDAMELVNEKSKAFQLAAYILDCVQSLEGAADEPSN
jgi:hypothetical protein